MRLADVVHGGGLVLPDGSSNANLVEQWENGDWSVVASPNPSPGLDGELTGVACTGVWSCVAVGDTPDDTPMLTEALSVEPGYWLAASDGGIFAFGSSGFYGSMGGQLLAQPVVGLAATPDRRGYWEVASDGGIFAFGDAGFYGSMGAKPLNQPIVGIASTPDGKGYWEVARDGGIFAFGDAGFYGSMGAKPLNQPIVGIASTADGLGYWLVASDGGIFAFGDAGFHGSMGGTPLTRPVVGIASTADGLGYWLVASDGGIFAFGDAGFFGSMGGQLLAQPIVGIALDHRRSGLLDGGQRRRHLRLRRRPVPRLHGRQTPGPADRPDGLRPPPRRWLGRVPRVLTRVPVTRRKCAANVRILAGGQVPRPVGCIRWSSPRSG